MALIAHLRTRHLARKQPCMRQHNIAFDSPTAAPPAIRRPPCSPPDVCTPAIAQDAALKPQTSTSTGWAHVHALPCARDVGQHTSPVRCASMQPSCLHVVVVVDVRYVAQTTCEQPNARL